MRSELTLTEENFPEILKRLRLNCGLSVSKAAACFGVTAMSIRDWEKKRFFPWFYPFVSLLNAYGTEVCVCDIDSFGRERELKLVSSDFHLYLKELRMSFGFSVSDVVKSSLISRHSIRRIEDGTHNPKLDTICALLSAYRKKIVVFFDNIETFDNEAKKTNKKKQIPVSNKNKKEKKANKRVLYTVYDNRTDFPVIVDGTSKECAKAMGITMNSFTSICHRSKHKKSKRWYIMRREVCTEGAGKNGSEFN